MALPQDQPQQGQGPTYGDERKRLAEESMKVDRAPVKIQRTEESRSDGHRIETTSNGDAKHVKKFGPDGKVISVKITTNDAANDPIDQQGPLVSKTEAEQGASPFVGPRQEDGGPIPGGAPAPFVGPRQEDGGPIPGGPAPAQVASREVGPARFEAPPRDWSTMDWTPVRKLTDDIYGTNIAEGSVDPYVAVYKRALEEFKLNNPGAGKGGKDSSLAWAKFEHTKKTDADKVQYVKDRDLEKDLTDQEERDEKIRQWQEEYKQKQGNYDSLAAYRNRKKSGKGGDGTDQYGYFPPNSYKGKKQRAEEKNRDASLKKKLQPTVAQGKAEAVAAAAQQAEHSYQLAVRGGKASGDFDPTSSTEIIDTYSDMPEILRWTQNKYARQAHSDSNRWLNTLLRHETGAAMPAHEVPRFRRMYFPGPGDTPEIVASKAEARRIKVNSAKVMQGMTEEERLAYWKEQAALEAQKLAQWEADNPVGNMTIELEDVKSKRAKNKAEQKKLKEELGL
jgi:hypothetical protein